MKWISVDKELPTNDNNVGDRYNCVLVFSAFNNSIAFGQYLEDHWKLLSDAIYSDVGSIGTIEEKHITHWMSLPIDPYLKEKNEKDG